MLETSNANISNTTVKQKKDENDFLGKGSNQIPADLNSVLDEKSPTSTGGVYTYMAICQIMDVQLTVAHPPSINERGWG